MTNSFIGIKVIVPRRAPDTEEFIRELAKAVRTTGEEMKADMEKTVETWQVKPEFALVLRVRDAQALVLSNSELWGWLNQGVEGHQIVPRNAPKLVYRRYYRSKTDVRLLGSGSGGKFGPIEKRDQVLWPGIEGRDWTGAINEKYRKRFQARVNIGMANAAKKSHRR